MSMTRALTVRMRGEMPPDTLLRMREILNLKRKGRLTDAEDVNFGYRYLQRDDQNWISLRLSRQNDMAWNFYLTYLKEPPSEDVINQTLVEIRAAASQLSFTIEDVVRQPRDGLRDCYEWGGE